ncbi:hypothetical protein H5079_18190, partial [Pseudoalteromonas sp. SG44-5]|uniref:hypothetical protein n=1 Tax=Pseudoalteromonas sp. SG44-5 TaxID=2760960 RepID=UPI0015F7BAB6
MRILIFLLALISAFFVSANEPDLTSLRSPQLKTFYEYECKISNDDIQTVVSEENSLSVCHPIWTPSIDSYKASKVNGGSWSSVGDTVWVTPFRYEYEVTPCKMGNCEWYGVDKPFTSGG